MQPARRSSSADCAVGKPRSSRAHSAASSGRFFSTSTTAREPSLRMCALGPMSGRRLLRLQQRCTT
eukprot:5868801-Prymnesium_polylepis.2